MRFTPKSQIPPPTWIEDLSGVRDVAQYLRSRRPYYGLDCETDGFGYEAVMHDGKTKRVGDGLGANLEVICLAFEDKRIAIDVGKSHRDNMWEILKAVADTQDRACGYNTIIDTNFMFTATDGEIEITRWWADGQYLWNHWDEDGEQTGGRRDLKTRSRRWLGLPMSNFDDVIHNTKGGIRGVLEDPLRAQIARNYSSKDPWATLGIVLLGRKYAELLPWCMECPHCLRPAFTPDSTKTSWQCATHGWVSGGQSLTMWDWHTRVDMPFLATLGRMQRRGVRIDTEKIRSWIEPLQAEIQRHLVSFNDEVGSALQAKGGVPWAVNPASPAQLCKLYFQSVDTDGKIVGFGYTPSGITESGQPSTDEDAIAVLLNQRAPGIASLQALRDMSKLLGTIRNIPAYVWEKTDRQHSKIRPDARTSRLAVKDVAWQTLPRDALEFEMPPAVALPTSDTSELAQMWCCSLEEAKAIQQLPQHRPSSFSAHLRETVIPAPGKLLLGADYRQIEIRAAAVASGDTNLQNLINDGVDLHSYVAAMAFGPSGGFSYEDIWERVQVKEGNKLQRFCTLGKYFDDPEALFRKRLQGCLLDKKPKTPREVEEMLAAAMKLMNSLKHDTSLVNLLQEAAKFDWSTGDAIARAAVLYQLIKDHVGAETTDQIFSWLGASDKLYGIKRQAAKPAFFGVLYMIGPHGLATNIAKTTGEPCDLETSKHLIHMIKRVLFPKLGEMSDTMVQTVEHYGYVRNLMGRYRHPAGIKSGNEGTRARARRQSGNAPIQMLVASIMEFVMVQLDQDPRFNELGGELLLQIHDELIAQAPEATALEAKARMVEIMETGHGLVLPVKFEASGSVGRNMAELK